MWPKTETLCPLHQTRHASASWRKTQPKCHGRSNLVQHAPCNVRRMPPGWWPDGQRSGAAADTGVPVAAHLTPGLLSSMSRSKLATRSPSGPKYSDLRTTPAAPPPPPAAAAPAPPPLAAAAPGARRAPGSGAAGAAGLAPAPGAPARVCCQLSTRDGTGRPPPEAVATAARRRAPAAPAGAAEGWRPPADCDLLRAQGGSRSSGRPPCTTGATPRALQLPLPTRAPPSAHRPGS
jgi:hypothetical protein